jgi:manganese/zinc/iron transport system substrate-binding protein
MKMKLLLLCLPLLAIFSGCSPTTQSEVPSTTITYEGDGPLKVVATTGMIGDITKNLGGTRVEVKTLMGPGVDPHLYKPTPADIRTLQNADIVFYNGLHLEGKMSDVLERVGENKTVVAVTTNIPEDQLLLADEATKTHDPHVWFDVSKWISATETARDALVKFDPKAEKTYRDNADKYLTQLKELDDYTRKEIASIPASSRVLVTAHDAFRYFGNAYKIEVEGLQGISTATEVSVRDVSRIVDLLVKRQIKAVFVESSVPKRTVEAVVQGCRARGHQVKIGGQLFSDAMGAENTPEGTYIGMVRANVKTIVGALK